LFTNGGSKPDKLMPLRFAYSAAILGEAAMQRKRHGATTGFQNRLSCFVSLVVSVEGLSAEAGRYRRIDRNQVAANCVVESLPCFGRPTRIWRAHPHPRSKQNP